MTSSPGRPKGTRVVQCDCGRRVAGLPGARVQCPDCPEKVLIKTGPRVKKPPMFLKLAKGRKK